MLSLYLKPTVLDFLLTQVYAILLVSKPFIIWYDLLLQQVSSSIRLVSSPPPKKINPFQLPVLQSLFSFSIFSSFHSSTSYITAIFISHLFQEAFPIIPFLITCANFTFSISNSNDISKHLS